MSNVPFLSLLIFLPLAGMLVILLLPKENLRAIRVTATVTAAVVFLISLLALLQFNWMDASLQMQEQAPWISSLNVNYSLGVDGLSLPLILLTTLLSLLSIIYSWRITERVKEYMAFFLLLETGMIGVFCALDFILFYMFWEISLVPMYFIIGIWGGPRREYAAIKFFLYTLVGSLAMLLGILVLYFTSNPHTFNLIELAHQQPLAAGGLTAIMVFWGLFLGFAIKVPMFPFHTWLPDAHVEAPTAGSVILAGVLLKMGGYGFLRISLPIMPQQFQQFALIIALLALISIVYGALVAMAQTDLKKLIAYSSVNHMGYVMLGIAAAAAAAPAGAQMYKITALNGAVLQMFNHGIITGALFFLVGVIYERAHLRDIDAFGGLAKQMPVYGGLMMLATFASLGLPGLAGFVSEFLVFLGSFSAGGLAFQVITSLSLLGLLFTAALLLWMLQRVFLGDLNPRWQSLKDMDRGELIAVVPLAAIMLAVGIYPKPLLDLINLAMMPLVEQSHHLHGGLAALLSAVGLG
ncbi:MAG TPA: NADH-quinone oxidoreductase subunit M [Armatimonadota bacterium]|jgi:NADH-quinone oxidoreductase subunit M